MDSNLFIKGLTEEEAYDLEKIINSFNVFTVTEIADLVNTVKEYSDEQVIQEINEGKVDVVIATHRLLSDDIEFKKLGADVGIIKEYIEQSDVCFCDISNSFISA